MMGASVERSRYSLSRTIHMFSAAMTEISEEFSSIAGRYKIVSLFRNRIVFGRMTTAFLLYTSFIGLLVVKTLIPFRLQMNLWQT